MVCRRFAIGILIALAGCVSSTGGSAKASYCPEGHMKMCERRAVYTTCTCITEQEYDAFRDSLDSGRDDW